MTTPSEPGDRTLSSAPHRKGSDCDGLARRLGDDAQLLQCLKTKERRGSKPRCHLLMHGPPDEIARRLTELIAPFGTVSASDRWMPQGFEEPAEAELHKASRLLPTDIRAQLAAWWLPPGREAARTPNFDIATTCTVFGRQGHLLVEAKAHTEEIVNEEAGRRLPADASEDRKASHETIGRAIESARNGLAEATLLPWKLSRDTRYQMSNRFAWAWKLATLGYSVVLVYLGLRHATEMADRGDPFESDEHWERAVKTHSSVLFPNEVWDKKWAVGNAFLVPIIRSIEWPAADPA